VVRNPVKFLWKLLSLKKQGIYYGIFLKIFLLLAFPLTPKNFKAEIPPLTFALLSPQNVEIGSKN